MRVLLEEMRMSGKDPPIVLVKVLFDSEEEFDKITKLGTSMDDIKIEAVKEVTRFMISKKR